MEFYIKKTVQPSIEPITATELKAHLKLSGTAEDTYLTSLITAARDALETYTGRSWCASTYVLALPDWFKQVELPYAADNTTVTSITYQDDVYPSPITTVAISASDYVVNTSYSPARVTMKSTWTNPAVTLAEGGDAIKITYTTGFSTANSVPLKFKQACLLYAGYLYEFREPEAKLNKIPSAVEALLATERIHSALSYTEVY